ncbi:hypothetical protein, partial [Klebsiella quasipneumoniae]|uniref:hypothetical protein n=1 Tax=Klebsiella quasipneumoniae TaxID=1463165 RepID=UPI001CA54102
LRASCPNRIPVISKLALVLDIYSSLSLIWRYSYCPVFQGATSNRGMAIPSGKRDVYFIEYALFSVAVGHNAFPN